MDHSTRDHDLRDRLTRAGAEPFVGWDFSRIAGRLTTEPLPWSYEAIVRDAIAGSSSLLDMDTGGGEVLARLAPLPPHTVATEGYRPNVPVARARLEPLGAQVVEVEGDAALPFPDDAFDLIITRHGAYRPKEIARLLRPGGRFITQQVGNQNLQDLNSRLGSAAQAFGTWTLDRARRELQAAGLRVTRSEEYFPASRFADIEAVAYLLKAVPWQVPDFSVEGYFSALKDLDQEIRTCGFVEVHDHRFFLTAEKLG